MKITIELEDKLLQKAARLLDACDHSTVINAALQALVERESARQIARLGGSDPDINQVPRRRAPEGPFEP